MKKSIAWNWVDWLVILIISIQFTFMLWFVIPTNYYINYSTTSYTTNERNNKFVIEDKFGNYTVVPGLVPGNYCELKDCGQCYEISIIINDGRTQKFQENIVTNYSIDHVSETMIIISYNKEKVKKTIYIPMEKIKCVNVVYFNQERKQ